jgi:hypothetical protein
MEFNSDCVEEDTLTGFARAQPLSSPPTARAFPTNRDGIISCAVAFLKVESSRSTNGLRGDRS